jgi:hypothetical protein
MSRNLSFPVNLALRAAPLLGSGSDPGSFANDLWTPGRDNNGRVNAASWAQVPRGRWVEVAGTRMDSLDAVVKAALPGWREYGGAGNGAWDGVPLSWSSWAVDKDGGRLWLFGGGHNNSSNNGLYRFDVFSMQWAVECLPSQTVGLLPEYLNGYSGYSQSFTTYYPLAYAAVARRDAGQLSPINDIWHDELPDGKPTARHSYRSLAYSPVLNKIIMACRRLWTYNLATHTWDYKRLFGDYVSPLPMGQAPNTNAFVNDQYVSAESMFNVYDVQRNAMYWTGYGSSGLTRQIGYDFNNNTWWQARLPFSNVSIQAGVIVGRNWTALRPPTDNTGGPGYSGEGEYKVMSLTTGGETLSSKLQLAGGLALTDFRSYSNEDDLPSLVYVDSINRYWTWSAMRNGYESMEIDPTTTPWTLSRKAFAGAAPQPFGLLGGKVAYFPGLNAVLFNDLATRNFSLYRL